MSTLTEFIKENIWCTAGQDKELTLLPDPLSFPSPDGAVPLLSSTSFFDFMYDQIPTPTKSDSWYIYALGTDYAGHNDLLQHYQKKWQLQKWQPFSRAVIEENIFIKVFTDKGIQFPLFETFYMFTNRRALLIAVRKSRLAADGSPKIPFNHEDDKVYVKFYKNSFYNSERSHVTGVNWNLKSAGRVLVSPNELVTINNTINALTYDRGYAFLYINGCRWKNAVPSDVLSGDTVEYIYDPTIFHVERIFVDTIKTYQSTLDAKTKVLLHMTKKDFPCIQYWDDLEIDLFKPVRTNVLFGVQVPILGTKVLRQLTDKDYGLDRGYLNTLKENLLSRIPELLTDSPIIEIKARHSGYDRPIVGISSHLGDLYTLSDSQQLNLMTSIPSPWTDWNADTLERSNYVRAMGEDYVTITNLAAETMIGYWGLASASYRNQRFVSVFESNSTVELQETFAIPFTVIPYNSAGALGDPVVQTSHVFTPDVPGTYRFLELFSGEGSPEVSARMGNSLVPYTDGFSFRVYACDKPGGVPDYIWTDITDTGEYTVNSTSHTVSFSALGDPRYLMVRDNSKFLLESGSSLPTAGVARVMLRETIDRNQGDGLDSYPLTVKTGQLMIWLNGRPLIKGIDYHLDFPNVFFWNYSILQSPDGVPFTYNYGVYGLGNGSGDFDVPVVKGFIEHGLIGEDNSFFFKKDRMLRTIVDGSLKYHNTPEFTQDNLGVVSPTNALNGLAYECHEYINDIVGIPLTPWQTLYEDAKVRDAALLTFLDGYRTPPIRGASTRLKTYVLVCPFYSKLIDDLQNGVVPDPILDPLATVGDVNSYLNGYQFLLDASPCNPINGVSGLEFIRRPHLHTLAVNMQHTRFEFLNRVVMLKTPGVISMTGFVNDVSDPLPAPTLVGFSHAVSTPTGTPFDITVPAGTAVGDLLIVCVAGTDTGGADFTFPTGWVLSTDGTTTGDIVTGYKGGVYQKVAEAGDLATITVSGTQVTRAASIVAMRDAIPVVNSLKKTSVLTGTDAGSVLTPAPRYSVSVHFFVCGDGGYTPPVGYTSDVITPVQPDINVYASIFDYTAAAAPSDPNGLSLVSEPLAEFNIIVTSE